MHIGVTKILNEPNLDIPGWEYVGTPADIVKREQVQLFTNERIYMPDLTKSSKDLATIVLGIFKFYDLDVYTSYVYKLNGIFFTKFSNPQIRKLPKFCISLLDYNNHDLEYLHKKHLITLQERKKKWFQTNEYGNEILKDGKRIFITENLMLTKGIWYLLETSNGYLIKNTSEVHWWLNWINKGHKNKLNLNETIKTFSETIVNHPSWIINDDYYKKIMGG